MSSYGRYGAKAGKTPLDEYTMNSPASYQDVENIYEGVLFDSYTGSGVDERDCSGYHWCQRFTLDGTTELGRIELDLAQDGTGANLTLEIRSDMDPLNGVDGDLLKSIVIPASWVPALQAYTIIPVGLAGLIAGAYYWFVIKKAGDATNHFHAYGETIQEGTNPCYYRAADTGNWTAGNVLHFKGYSGLATADDKMVASIQSGSKSVYIYNESTGLLEQIKYALLSIENEVMVDQVYNLTRIGTKIIRGVSA